MVYGTLELPLILAIRYSTSNDKNNRRHAADHATAFIDLRATHEKYVLILARALLLGRREFRDLEHVVDAPDVRNCEAEC